MSGHNKWSKIKFKKGATDSKRSKVFSKHSKKITIAARESDDPEFNSALRVAIDNAKADNMPNENIDRAVKKGSGAGAAGAMDEIVYEGYASAGVAILVHTVTDSRNRTSAEMRHIFSKHGGNMGAIGSVSWMFEKKGVLEMACETKEKSEEIELLAIDLGADDFSWDDEEKVIFVYFPPDKLVEAKKSLEEKGFMITRSEVSLQSKNIAEVSDSDQDKVIKLLDALDDDDDVTEVATNLG